MTQTSLISLGLFTGQPQYDNFCRFKDILPVSRMAASTTPYDFAEGSALSLPQTYSFAGEERSTQPCWLPPTHRLCWCSRTALWCMNSIA